MPRNVRVVKSDGRHCRVWHRPVRANPGYSKLISPLYLFSQRFQQSRDAQIGRHPPHFPLAVDQSPGYGSDGVSFSKSETTLRGYWIYIMRGVVVRVG